MNKIDVRALLEPTTTADPEPRGISAMARSLIGSEILKIAGEVRQKVAAGENILNLTVGDFSPKEFPLPDGLREAIVSALNDGHTNYPPSSGEMVCREAVRDLFESRLGLSYPVESVLIASGARPMIAGSYLALIDPGTPVIYGLPSWNNNHYCTIVGAERREIPASPESHFFVKAADVEPHLAGARLLALNTPQNPTGTVMDKEAVKAIAQLVVDENNRRKKSGAPALYLMFDQIYWMLTFDGVEHHTPVSLVPEVAPYTIFVDGISKGFSATGVRVGWAVGPQDVIKRMGAILTHIGAWAPKAEQIATAQFLQNTTAMDAHLNHMVKDVLARLRILWQTVKDLKEDGWNVDAIAPQGAIYLSLKLDLRGKKTPDGNTLDTDEDVRRFILEKAGVALIPFRCFGLREDSGWYRASVGAVSVADCESIGPRLKRALDHLS